MLRLPNNIQRISLGDSRDDSNSYFGERRALYDQEYIDGEFSARWWKETIAEWQDRWNKPEKGHQTRTIIWDISRWSERPLDEVYSDQTIVL